MWANVPEVGAGDDQVHPHLVGADQVVDRLAGLGVADGDGRRVVGSPGPDAGGHVEADVEAGVVGARPAATSVSSMTLIAGRIGMPMPSDQASTPFMPRSAWSVRLTQVNPAPRARATTAMPTR